MNDSHSLGSLQRKERDMKTNCLDAYGHYVGKVKGEEGTNTYTCNMNVDDFKIHLLDEGMTGDKSNLAKKATDGNPRFEYATKIITLKPSYTRGETARFRLFTRQKDWSPTIYSKATTAPQNTIVDSASYQIKRVVDDLNVISHGTASQTLHTQLSFDVTGNYFDLDMSLLEPGYSYAIHLAYYNGAIGAWVEQDQMFKFRVE